MTIEKDNIIQYPQSNNSSWTAVKEKMDRMSPANFGVPAMSLIEPVATRIIFPKDNNVNTDLLKYELADTGNSDRLAAYSKPYLRYCNEWGSWLFFDGVRWVPRDTKFAIDVAIDTIRTYERQVDNMTDGPEKTQATKWVRSSKSEIHLARMERLARNMLSIDNNMLDKDPFLFNVANGTLNIATGELQPHNWQDYITKLSPIAYDTMAECYKWMVFLRQIMNGDESLLRYLQRAIGYSLSGSTRSRLLFVMYGTGANGKSTFLNVIHKLLGDYAKTTNYMTFLDTRSSESLYGLADLVGARFISTSEMPGNIPMNESIIKLLTGEDLVTARHIYHKAFTYRPICKVWIASNNKPEIKEKKPAIWDRLRMIPFNVTIKKSEIIVNYQERLIDELPGILAWAFQGAIEWYSQEFPPCEAVAELTQEHREEKDFLSNFKDEYCIEDIETFKVWATVKDLHATYCSWCIDNKEEQPNVRVFGKWLNQYPYKRKKTNRDIIYYGIGLKKDYPQGTLL